MIHIRTDDEPNSSAKFECGIASLPEGDKAIFEAELGLHHMVDCPGCMAVRVQLGTPFSQLTGNFNDETPGRSYSKFVEITRTWGFD